MVDSSPAPSTQQKSTDPLKFEVPPHRVDNLEEVHVKAAASESRIQTYQVLTNDDEVCISCLSGILSAYRIYEWYLIEPRLAIFSRDPLRTSLSTV